jgi:hypothetical protein
VCVFEERLLEVGECSSDISYCFICKYDAWRGKSQSQMKATSMDLQKCHNVSALYAGLTNT